MTKTRVPDISVRPARREDLPALTEIYNYEVVNGVSTFDTDPWTVEQRATWFDAHDTGDSALFGAHPLLVIAVDDKVEGYASLSSFRDKDAYSTTVELSVYIHPERRRQGLAHALMTYVIELARRCEDVRCIVSVITAGNKASVALHKRFGFSHAGTLHGVACKFGKWLDTEYWELAVSEISLAPGPFAYCTAASCSAASFLPAPCSRSWRLAALLAWKNSRSTSAHSSSSTPAVTSNSWLRRSSWLTS